MKCNVFLNMQYDIDKIKEALKDQFEIEEGQKVVIKPNWVAESHLERKDEWEQIITHPTVILAVLDLVCEKLNGTGEVAVLDSPMPTTDFEKIMEYQNVREKILQYNKTGTKVQVLDIRDQHDIIRGDILVKSEQRDGDPHGMVSVDLKTDSLFQEKKNKNYHGGDYDYASTRKLHNDYNNKYFFSKTVLEADVVISIPKLKTHRLAGMTCCLKNTVGMTMGKNAIPHYTVGTKADGGDDYPEKTAKAEFEMKTLAIVKKVWKKKNPVINTLFIPLKKVYAMLADNKKQPTIRGGIWYGNDTIWRSVLDLNKILFYSDTKGEIKEVQQRKVYYVVDAIVGGEGFGPTKADYVFAGFILTGDNPVVIDTVACSLMGFDYQKVPTVYNAYRLDKHKLVDIRPEEIKVCSNRAEYNNITFGEMNKKEPACRFKPAFGWIGNIERN